MGTIAIVGLEQDATGAVDGRVADRLLAADVVIVPSATGASVALVASLGIEPVTFGDLGLDERAPADQVVEALLERSRDQNVALAVFGYPFVREGLMSGILARNRRGVDIYPVVSPLQVLLLALDLDATADLEIIDAGSLSGAARTRDAHLIVTGVDNPILARVVAEQLRDRYAPDHTVVISAALDSGGFDLAPLTVDELSRVESVDRQSAVYVPPVRIAAPGGFAELVRIIGLLRAPDGCPWDREQTHASLAPHLIEEAYEGAAAAESGDDPALADELGDVLLQVVLHAQIGAEEGAFTIDDVIAGIITKIRRRHPHIFGTVTAETTDEVTRNWDAIKREEKPQHGVLGEVPDALPSLMRAQKISRRAAGVGFEWEDIDGVWAKVHEEIDELKATEHGTPEAEDELGDLLFTVVNVARKMGVDAEAALRRTCEKFSGRFEDMEAAAAAASTPLEDLQLDEWEQLWAKAKQKESAATRGPAE
ncbi:MAG: nucleoside triphosphate pyrophosphohydrolase [Coriobacteriia bacterium]|nr:nucleoside triphosphate pyrophosphohydrolase [Coriobacteriia bacterium]